MTVEACYPLDALEEKAWVVDSDEYTETVATGARKSFRDYIRALLSSFSLL